MTTKPENTFIAGVHKHLPEDVYRMKNHNPYLGGLPDCWYSGAKADLWIEYKFVLLPTRDSTVMDLRQGSKPALSVLQQEWLRSRYNEGRNVGVLVGCAQGGVWFPGVTWDNFLTAGQFKSRLESRSALAGRIATFVRG